MFYCFKALLQLEDGDQGTEGSSAAPRSPVDVAKQAMTTYKQNFWADNIAMCSVVIPGDILTFGAPMWLRLPANHLISFFWVCYLSFLRGDAAVEASPAPTVEASVETEGAIAAAAPAPTSLSDVGVVSTGSRPGVPGVGHDPISLEMPDAEAVTKEVLV